MRDMTSLSMLLGPAGLLRRHALALTLAGLAGVAASAATVALLARINAALHRPAGPLTEMVLAFTGLGLAMLAGRATASALSNRTGQAIIQELRLMLAQRILAAPLDALERYRTHRLVPVLTQDVGMVSGLCLSLPMTVVAASVVVGCVLWLAWLSWQLAVLVLSALALSLALQRWAQERAIVRFEAARSDEDALHKAWRTLGDGAKELRLSRSRRRQLLDGRIARHAADIARAQVQAGDLYALSFEASAALYFLLVALVFAAARLWQLPSEVAGGFVLALLYMKGSLDQVLGFLPFYARARVALGRVDELGSSFSNPESSSAEGTPPPLMHGIALQGVRYAYEAADGVAPFTLGPLDLQLRRGEILFIAGDNGAGKTTLLKLLTGLYRPQQGELLLDGRQVDDAGRDAYRQLFSPVLSDFHLFEELPDTDAPPAERDAAAQAALERLGLAHKLSVRAGRLSSTDLSTGQRKRLAMVHAWAEARPVMVFDEWAADQDPAFRTRFYREFLPALREHGHTLVVISHDERYFDVADRVLVMDGGRLQETAVN
ncbi:cyclic peptide export ABC transporter [Variovorax arabinosiphilus]|uniref:cyclic peptide export ABC transporter n=2 Tax=Variovorax arabinosiphilus TaxID=3053498 RepID=UPI0025758CE6|nr:cyclic peptide export ABC transporter [Variovorax sp. J2R1-6]MDM0236077.1 cyclic peptide export ABC transporter [Variovorax sp. J2R1-6]